MRNDKPSATAYLIARGTYLLSRDPALGFLVPERAGEISGWFVQSRCPLSRSLDAITSFRPIAYALERLTIPGIKLHYALRKRYLEEIARDSLERGTRQVVIIGAGFDTLALRLHDEFPETEFFEADILRRKERKSALSKHTARPEAT